MNDYDDDELNDHDRILPLLLPLSQFHHHHHHENDRVSNWHDAYAYRDCVYCDHVPIYHRDHENDRVSNLHGAYAYRDCVYCDHVAVYRCDHENGYAWYGYECDRDVR